MYASVKCVGPCKAGFVMRAEKTPDGGMKGVLMSVTENDLVPYIVKIDASGGKSAASRLRLRRGGAVGRPAVRRRPVVRSPATPDNLTAPHDGRDSRLGRTGDEPGSAASDVPRACGAVSEGVAIGRPSLGCVHAG